MIEIIGTISVGGGIALAGLFIAFAIILRD